MPPFGSTTSGFREFSDLLTGYRLSTVLMLAHRAGIFARVGRDGCTLEELVGVTGWDAACGERFCRCLCSLGLLGMEQGRMHLAPLAARFLDPASPDYQGRTLDFEEQLVVSWQHLEQTLQAGRRVFLAEEKCSEDFNRALAAYQGAMDEAARIRSSELWDSVPIPGIQGLLLDLGAGSGAYLLEFLRRNPGWRAIYADLPEVTATTCLRQAPPEILNRIAWLSGNLLEQSSPVYSGISDQSCDVVLLSNLLHCQGAAETLGLLTRAAEKTAPGGCLVLHDFFLDTDWRGHLYDLHMMLNTYNGRTYPLTSITDMVHSLGLPVKEHLQLPSGSTVLLCGRPAAGSGA